MPAIILDANEIDKLIPKIDVQQALRTMFLELSADKAVQPAQSLTLFPGDQGDVITYQGVMSQSQTFGVKLSPYLVRKDKPVITAWTCLMSMQTGQPIMLCDSARLTTERTAGTTALAVDYLSASNSDILCIIGSGNIALAHWNHVKDLRDWREVRLWSPSLKSNDSKQALWLKHCPILKITDSAELAAENADAVMLCTSSGTPVLDTNAVKNGALVTSISTNVAQAYEVAPEFLNKAQVYCDYQETTPAIAGEMVLAAQDHGWKTNLLIGDLADLVAKKCAKPSSDAPIFFRSMGLGLEDIAIANEVYREHKKLGAES